MGINGAITDSIYMKWGIAPIVEGHRDIGGDGDVIYDGWGEVISRYTQMVFEAVGLLWRPIVIGGGGTGPCVDVKPGF